MGTHVKYAGVKETCALALETKSHGQEEKATEQNRAPRLRCPSCGRFGHAQETCRVWRLQMKCHPCGGLGHVKVACASKDPKSLELNLQTEKDSRIQNTNIKYKIR
eukprot:GHVP01016692.1.p1 GENE.GHVP01016692.1~~GHVP01016692.1.p1  ORF type:complete len:106 (-),score=17.26 GHVP01016692.1:901-1218(-)